MITFKMFQRLTLVSNFLRLAVPFFLFAFPIATTVTIFLLDGIDGEIYKRAGYPRSFYSMYDKLLDYYWYLFVFCFVLFNPVPFKTLFLFLFFYRSIGQFMYLWKQVDAYLFLFPNIFEILFFVYLLGQIHPVFSNLLTPPYIYTLLTLLTPFMLLREYTIHIKRVNFSHFLGQKTFWIDEKN